MPTRTARTTWTGGLEDGAGTVALVSSGLGSYEVSFPKRAADDADGTHQPGGTDRRGTHRLLCHAVLRHAGRGRRQRAVARRHRGRQARP